MPKQRQRIPLNDDRPLSDTPFAALLGGGVAPAPAASPPPDPADGGGPAWSVARTRKGGLPVFLEKRGGGRVVTIVREAEGDLAGALASLRRLCGAGGAVRDGSIELQGDHRERVEAYLRENARLRPPR